MKQINESSNSNGLAIGAKIRISLSSLSHTEQRIIEWMMIKGNLTPMTGIKEVASKLSVSEPLLVKVAKKLGYSGFREIRKALLSYFEALPFDKEQELSEKDNIDNIIEKVFNNSVQALKEAQSIVDANIISQAAEWIFHASRIVILGVGGSAIVGQDFEHKLLRIGILSHTYSDNHLMAMVASQLKENDVVIAISQSGNTVEICNAIMVAKKHKARIICITNNHQSEIAQLSDLSIFSPAKNGPLLGQNAAARIIQLTLLDTLFIAIVFLDNAKSKVHLERSIDIAKSLHRETSTIE